MSLVSVSRRLAEAVDELTFSEPVTHVYNPLRYARQPHERYLRKYGTAPKQVLLVGMNPGPYGMAQTGVPFGEIAAVRDFLGIEGEVRAPEVEHPKRAVQGFDCPRSEVSGRRLWGWVQEHFTRPEHFFRQFFVYNYCPLVFMEASGRNFTPDKLSAQERSALFRVCDSALLEVLGLLKVQWAIGVGKFAEARIRAAAGSDVKVGNVLHPSPASPAANRGWAEQAERRFSEYGLLERSGGG